MSAACPRCGGSMLGDGFGTVRHCENADQDDYWHSEPDADPVLCKPLEDGNGEEKE
jgi:uncharacterized protein (DUF983 family)